MLRKCLVLFVSVLPLLSANAAERRVYPGVILSNRSTPSNERSLEDSAKANNFIFLSSERLASGSVHVSDKRVKNVPFLSPKRPAFCRTAKVRRIIKSARGHISCSTNDEFTATVDPNDSMYPLQYAHSLMESKSAWDITTGSDSLIAVIIDTGVDYNHSDLQANMWGNPSEIPSNGIDDDKNGYIDDVYGINAITNSGNPLDDNGHGTHVAGIIGAVGNNARGVVGVNWKVKLAAVKFLSASGSGSSANAIKAITYATELKKAGHKVIATNNSWGGGASSIPLGNAIIAASQAGVLFIAAAGNSASNNDIIPFYPASYQIPNIISVASTSAGGALSSFSNFGVKTVHIAAPGSSIYSTLRGNGYGYKSGTSMAAPQITGLALLAASACGRLDMPGLRSTILTSATPNNYLLRLIANRASANANGAVSAAKTACDIPPGMPIPIPPTPTPMPTPTPTPKNDIIPNPSRASAGQTISFKMTTGVDYVNSGTVEIKLHDLAGTEYPCDYKSYVLLTKGQKSLSVKIPMKAKHFASMEITFTSRRGTQTTVVEILDPQPTLVPYSTAERACKDLTSQFR